LFFLSLKCPTIILHYGWKLESTFTSFMRRIIC